MDKSTCLVIDIETWSDSPINSFDYINTAVVKWVGLYSYRDDKYFEVMIEGHPKNKEKVIAYIENHKTLIGFNCNEFDFPILKNNGFMTPYHYQVDCMQIMSDDKRYGGKGRGPLMGYDFKTNSLKSMAEAMHIKTHKGDIDYKIFKKDVWSKEEKNDIKKYLHADIEITKHIFDKLYDFWLPSAAFLDEKNKKNFSWIKSTIACMGYKMICNCIGVEEEYNSDTSQRAKFPGGHVQEPMQEEVLEDCVSFDFGSLYPLIFIQCNLFSYNCKCCKPEEKWHGDGFFSVKGYYCTKHQGKIEELIRRLYILRLDLKRQRSSQQYAIKININSMYGIAASPVFKNVYNQNSAEDCTSIGRTCVKTAIKMFNDAGFSVIYSDTDSCYVRLNGKTKHDAVMLSKKIVEALKSHMPFPWEFEFKHENDIKYMMFIKDENGKFLKKNYAYVHDDKVEIMGMPVIKSSATELGKKILDDYIIPRMKTEHKGKFEKEWVMKIIKEEIEKNPALIAQEYKCNSYDSYPKEINSIWKQISKAYLNEKNGYIKLIKNKKIGKVGQEKTKYCTVEEAKILKIYDLELEKLYNELSPFVRGGLGEREIKNRTLGEFV